MAAATAAATRACHSDHVTMARSRRQRESVPIGDYVQYNIFHTSMRIRYIVSSTETSSCEYQAWMTLLTQRRQLTFGYELGKSGIRVIHTTLGSRVYLGMRL